MNQAAVNMSDNVNARLQGLTAQAALQQDAHDQLVNEMGLVKGKIDTFVYSQRQAAADQDVRMTTLQNMMMTMATKVTEIAAAVPAAAAASSSSSSSPPTAVAPTSSPTAAVAPSAVPSFPFGLDLRGDGKPKMFDPRKDDADYPTWQKRLLRYLSSTFPGIRPLLDAAVVAPSPVEIIALATEHRVDAATVRGWSDQMDTLMDVVRKMRRSRPWKIQTTTGLKLFDRFAPATIQ